MVLGWGWGCEKLGFGGVLEKKLGEVRKLDLPSPSPSPTLIFLVQPSTWQVLRHRRLSSSSSASRAAAITSTLP